MGVDNLPAMMAALVFLLATALAVSHGDPLRPNMYDFVCELSYNTAVMTTDCPQHLDHG
jgi:hypothetical protein